MKQAKQHKRAFKDLSAWDVLTGEAENKRIRKILQDYIDNAMSNNLFYNPSLNKGEISLWVAGRNTGKTMMSDYMFGVQSRGRALREPKEQVSITKIGV